MSVPMTEAECRIATEALSEQLDRYARLIVRTGCAIKPGQQLLVRGPVERADFVRRVVAEAYAAGSGPVTVIWDDDVLTRLNYENNDIEFFEQVPEWKRLQLDSIAEAGAALLFLDGSDPMMLKGIDPKKPATWAHAVNTQCTAYRNGMDFGKNVWCIAGVPVAKWAKTVFPELSESEAVYRLWLAILATARADGEDPSSDWETHNASFEKTKRFLNEKHFDALRYRSDNGTDFTVGLPAGHIWEGGAGRTVDGTVFFPNMPTEEVFTTPDRMRADGIVYSALPLVHAGQIVRDFWFRFEGGAVVDYGAEQGKDVLRSILERDENAVRLGECALISKNTPIRQSEILFFDTLYDENASCHLALGMGFPECLEGGLEMDRDELIAHGVNQSVVHVDFMIGADDLDIVGIGADGTETQIFVNGQWVWE